MPILSKDTQTALENIYVSPLELCNLNCRYCYTKKTKSILSTKKILTFVRRYKKEIPLKSILFCGGEVFAQKNFPELVNKLHLQNIFVSVITNGTINRFKEIKSPNQTQLLVSLDGPEKIHDFNRGHGNFQKSISFIKQTLLSGFFVEIMFLVNKQSYPYIRTFEKNLQKIIGQKIPLNFMTQKTKFYTDGHPLSNTKNINEALTPQQILNIKKNYKSTPTKNFGCFQLSLQSDGKIYGCCESPAPLAKMNEPIKNIIKKFKQPLSPCQKCKTKKCHGCCTPKFLCGYNKEMATDDCKKTFKLFN